MTLAKWIRTKVFRSVDPVLVREVKRLSLEVSLESKRLKRQTRAYCARDALDDLNGYFEGRNDR